MGKFGKLTDVVENAEPIKQQPLEKDEMGNEVNLDILPIREVKDSLMPTSRPISDNLPNPPFVMTLVAPVKSGKSTIVGNLLLRFYPSCFDTIWYFSPTAEMDKTTKSFLKAFEDDERQELTIFDKHEDLLNLDTYIDIMCEEQKKTPQAERKRVLFVIDDCVGYKMKQLNFMVSRHRHFNISIIISSQMYRKLDPIMRVNSTAIIICKVSNGKEFMKLEEECLENIPNYLEHYNTATKKRYDFLFFNMTEQKLYHNFKTLLWEK